MVSGEGAHVALKGFVVTCRATGATIDAMGSYFGTKQRGRGWPLLYDHVGMCVETHAIDHTSIPI
jgi:hypothetical protein